MEEVDVRMVSKRVLVKWNGRMEASLDHPSPGQESHLQKSGDSWDRTLGN